MQEWAVYTKFFIGLLSIVNPVGALPFFVNLTGAFPTAERKRTAFRASVAVGVILAVTLVAGAPILTFFGITISSFRIAGGILLLLMSVSTLQAQVSRAKQTEEEVLDAAERNSIAVVPVGMPLLAGPGAISAVIVYAESGAGIVQRAVFAVEIALISAIVWAVLAAAPHIAKRLGRTGINVVMRIMGLIMTAVGVEFIAAGLRQMFPGLN